MLLYEMMAGYPPFTGSLYCLSPGAAKAHAVDPNNYMNLFAKIREPDKIVYPPFFTAELIDLFRKYDS